jgi:hypothetical protein
MSPTRRSFVAALLTGTLCLAARHPSELPSDLHAVLARISPDSMRGHVSFLASDLLEGRGTPSRGLDLAGEYIAAQFRRAGLEPAGDNAYFQTAAYLSLEPNPARLRFEVDGRAIDPDKIAADTSSAVSLENAEAIKWAHGQAVEGKVVFVEAADYRGVAAARKELEGKHAGLVVYAGPAAARLRPGSSLIPAESRGRTTPALNIRDENLAAEIEKAEPGPLPFRVTASVAEPAVKEVKLRNVVGILRGSDAALKDTCVLVTAHYDHLGVRAGGDGDRIFNGANDDASGVASLIEIAAALQSLTPHPRRSIVFAALFGEELGLLGSRYYGAHPVIPLANTVADVNLEHMGRTDSDLGPHLDMVNFTGFDFSEVPSIFKKAGALTGISVVKDRKNSDAYFARSDNQAMADMGVPAHTLSVSYEFPDYHKEGDEWEKLDYDNMARVDRMVALGLVMIAENPLAPKWNSDEPKTRRYVEAAGKLRP